jgi:hypothetical protein
MGTLTKVSFLFMFPALYRIVVNLSIWEDPVAQPHLL